MLVKFSWSAIFLCSGRWRCDCGEMRSEDGMKGWDEFGEVGWWFEVKQLLCGGNRVMKLCSKNTKDQHFGVLLVVIG